MNNAYPVQSHSNDQPNGLSPYSGARIS